MLRDILNPDRWQLFGCNLRVSYNFAWTSENSSVGVQGWRWKMVGCLLLKELDPTGLLYRFGDDVHAVRSFMNKLWSLQNIRCWIFLFPSLLDTSGFHQTVKSDNFTMFQDPKQRQSCAVLLVLSLEHRLQGMSISYQHILICRSGEHDQDKEPKTIPFRLAQCHDMLGSSHRLGLA